MTPGALFTHPLAVAAVLAANVWLAERLAQRGPLRRVGGALLVIVITAIEANLRWIPTVSPTAAHPVYEGVFGVVAPLSIFWLLLQVNLREVWRAGAQMLVLFAIGSVGVMAGTLAGMRLFGGGDAFGAHTAALGGMFAGTYIGGSLNFNAIALHYGVMRDAMLFAGANVVDAALTTVWMIVTVAAPRLLAPIWPGLRPMARPEPAAEAMAGHEPERESAGPSDLALVIALGGAAVAVADWVAARAGVPSVLTLTTLALTAAQVPAIQRLRGYRSLGLLAVSIFLAVVGALCDLSALAGLGGLAVRLSGLVLTILLVHAAALVVAARALRLDAAAAAVASQACIGGSTTALALARGLDRPDLAAPGILAGALGTAVGTYAGFLIVAWLQ